MKLFNENFDLSNSGWFNESVWFICESVASQFSSWAHWHNDEASDSSVHQRGRLTVNSTPFTFLID